MTRLAHFRNRTLPTAPTEGPRTGSMSQQQYSKEELMARVVTNKCQDTEVREMCTCVSGRLFLWTR